MKKLTHDQKRKRIMDRRMKCHGNKNSCLREHATKQLIKEHNKKVQARRAEILASKKVLTPLARPKKVGFLRRIFNSND